MRGERVKIFFDGGCRPNPGPIEVAAVVGGIAHIRDDIGHGSNGDAEWLALIHAIGIAREMGLDDVVLLGDSAQVIHQASGAWKCRGPTAQAHRAAYLAAAAGIGRITLRHVPRARNLAGIALAARHR